MATIASLNVLLGMDISGFASKGKKAESTLQSIAASASRVSGILTGAVAALAGGALLSSLQETAQAADATGKLSDRLGIATEALIGLQHAADVGGLGADTINKGLEMMTKNLGAMVASGGGATDLLSRFGLNARELAQMAPDKAFMAVADAVSQIQNPTERAALAVGVFGKSGQQLLNVLAMGSTGLEQMRADVESLGGSFSRLEAAKIEEANDAMTRMGVAIRGIKTQAIVTFAPMVTAIANVVSANHGAILSTIKWAGTVAAVSYAVGKLVSVGAALIKTLRAIAASQAIVAALSGPAGMVALVAGAAAATLAVQGINLAFDKIGEGASQAVAEVSNVGKGLTDLEPALKGVSGRTQTWRETVADINNDIVEMTMGLEKQIATFEMTTGEAELWELSMRGATDAQLDGVRALQEQLAVMKEQKEVAEVVADFFSRPLYFEKNKTPQSAGTELAAVSRRFVQGPQSNVQQRGLDKLNKTAERQLKEQAATRRAVENIGLGFEPPEVADI